MITGVLEAKYLSQFMAKTLSEMNGVDVAAIKEKVKKNYSKNDIEPFFPDVSDGNLILGFIYAIKIIGVAS